MQKKIISKEFTGIQPVYSTNVEKNGNYISEGNIINKNCLIDTGYQGEIHINLINISNNISIINAGDKIIQFVPYFQPDMNTVKEYTSFDDLYNGVVTERGTGGFGSTDGTKNEVISTTTKTIETKTKGKTKK